MTGASSQAANGNHTESVDASVSSKREIVNACLPNSGAKSVKTSVDVSGSLHSRTTVHGVIPYSEIYGAHPSLLMSTVSGLQYVSNRSDPYTGKGGDVMKGRLDQHLKSTNWKRLVAHRKLVLENQKLMFYLRGSAPAGPGTKGLYRSRHFGHRSKRRSAHKADEGQWR